VAQEVEHCFASVNPWVHTLVSHTQESFLSKNVMK
jgi:hypothetical protein